MRRTDWTSEHDFAVDGVSYRSMTGRATGDEMVVLKPKAAVEGYEELLAALQPRTMVELGIYGGGSAALLAQLAEPEKFVVIDLQPGCTRLDAFIDARGLRGCLMPYYGVDQADAARLEEIIGREFDGPLDLVIDDASHLEAETRASFNQLFPHVRPGGAYVIEDWSWAHNAHPNAPHMQGATPLSVFVLELMIVASRRPRMIDRIVVNSFSATVWRGPADLRAGRFDVSTQVGAVGQKMIDGSRVARSE
jgi:cephalosporin hydroxylase